MTNNDKQIIIKAKVTAGSKIIGVKTVEIDGEKIYRLYVNVPPENGKANNAVIKLLSSEFNVPKSNVVILNGELNKNKTIKINLK